MRNDPAGQVLALGSLALDLEADLENLGALNAGEALFVQSGGSVINNDGSILSQTGIGLAAQGCITNSGDIQSGGAGLFRAGGTLLNEGEILAVGDAVFEIGEDLENSGTLHSGEVLTLTSASLDNSGQILAQGDGAFSVLGDLVNTNFLFSGGAATFSVGGMLHNLRGQILSLGDMVLEGLSAGSRMLELKNDSGTVETLKGSMSIRAKVVRNTNLDFALTPGTQVLSRKGGIYSFFGDNWDQAQDLYRMLPGSSTVSSKRNALIITPAELRALGFGLDRNVIPRSELDAAIAAAEARFALYGGTSGDIAAVSSLKSRVVGRGIYMAVQHYKDRSKVAAYLESITLDEVTGLESGANIAAAVNLDIAADSFSNHVSRVATASGDISIVADSFENAGQDIFEHRTIEWARAHANEHKSPRLAVEGLGTEVVRTAVDHAYGTISAGGRVSISADHAMNGISENSGMASGEIGASASVIAPPRPDSLDQSVAHLDDLIGLPPRDGLFIVNTTPGHRYLIETNPTLTSMALFYGSDYFLRRTGIDLSKTRQQLLGDAFHETRLVREQIFALTGRRFLSESLSGDVEQMLALMDNAVAAREELNLSVGVALSAEQVEALASDIVWLETRVVEGHEVLVPVV
jgi:filamentous hemagglutinin